MCAEVQVFRDGLEMSWVAYAAMYTSTLICYAFSLGEAELASPACERDERVILATACHRKTT